MSAAQGNNADTNPGNFANRSKEEVQAIASMGGHASHGGHGDAHGESDNKHAAKTTASHKESEHGGLPGRNPDGTFTKGSKAAAEAGSHSHDNDPQ